MYITNQGRTYYGMYNEQRASRASFLILVQDKDQPIGPNNFRALVRKVALQQFGPWMMGTARVFNQFLTISGAYGNDGLPISVSKEIYDKAIPVPKHLYDLWNKGGGWNSAGSEASEIRKWAIKTFLPK
jgi:hypothetical protein